MAKSSRSALLALCLIISCKSSDPGLELAAAVSPEADPATSIAENNGEQIPLESSDEVASASCSELPSCTTDEQKTPYFCVAYRYAGQLLWEGQRIYAWASSLCEAKRNLAKTACDQGKDFAQLGDLSCSPDPTMGSCPVAAPRCSPESKPSKCFAKKYQGTELTWEQRPTAWGRNECETRHLVQVRACEQGLEPLELSSISCESDNQPGQCPPAPPACALDQRDPTECQLNNIGDIVLKKPWRAIGTSACEAEHHLRSLLCRYADLKTPLTLDQTQGIECRSLVGGGASSGR